MESTTFKRVNETFGIRMYVTELKLKLTKNKTEFN